MKAKTTTAWVFKWYDGAIAIKSINYTRSEVIVWAEAFFDMPWRKIKYRGNSAIKIKIKEVKP